jgi:hypothetical protein
MKNKFGNSLDNPSVYQAFEAYVKTLSPLEQKRIILNLRKTNKTLHSGVSPSTITILDVLDCSDISKIEMYTSIVSSPQWDVIMPRLKMFRNSILLTDPPQHWHRPQWLLYLSFVMYTYYLGKSRFEVIGKGLHFFVGTQEQKNKATMEYIKLSASKHRLKLKDFYDYMNKYFVLRTLEMIGY